MAASFQCDQVIRDCPCSDFPLINTSAETPDRPVFIANATPNTPPPLCGNCAPPPGCLGQAESTVSQEDADLEAQAAADLCRSGDPPGNVYPIHGNTEQTCTVECPDSLPFSWTVPAGVIYSPWQADANARAYSLACQRARAARVCITTEELAAACMGTFYSELIDATGGVAPYSWAVTSGSLPAGLTLDPSAAVILGTPTASGSSAFTITVTDAIGSTQSKPFTLVAYEITSPDALPDATIGTPYLTTLAVSPAPAAPNWVLVSGSLPPGLLLAPDGSISGTPSAPAAVYVFTVEVQDSDVGLCQKTFTLESNDAFPGFVQIDAATAAHWATVPPFGGIQTSWFKSTPEPSWTYLPLFSIPTFTVASQPGTPGVDPPFLQLNTSLGQATFEAAPGATILGPFFLIAGTWTGPAQVTFTVP